MPTEATGNRQGGRSKPTALKVLHLAQIPVLMVPADVGAS